MVKLPQDFKDFLTLLNSHSVDYLLVGDKLASARPKDLADLDNLPCPPK